MEFRGESLEAVLDGACLAPHFRELHAHDDVAELPSSANADDLRPFVLRNQPVVVRGVLRQWQPVLRWSDDDYLQAAGSGKRIPVRCAEEGSGTFGDPSRCGVYKHDDLDWQEFLQHLDAAEQQLTTPRFYAAQLRLRSELPNLYQDTRPAPGLLSVLGPLWRSAPSAYIGSGSRTPLHFDLLENLLCMVRGHKRVQLWHPAHGHLLQPGGGGQALFSKLDPSRLQDSGCPSFASTLSLGHVVDLDAGDALYLPCAWWHVVCAAPGERCISLTYWTQQPDEKMWTRPIPTEEEW